jgi:hypothetical protein
MNLKSQGSYRFLSRDPSGPALRVALSARVWTFRQVPSQQRNGPRPFAEWVRSKQA